MQSLAKLISNLHPIETMHFADRTITGLKLDSREVREGDMFFAIKGTQVDGHRFMESAAAKGASAIICEEFPSEPKDGVVYIRFADSAQAMGELAAAFYERPSDKMKLVGITGTNGKTSIVSYLFDLFTSMGYKCGMLSTVGNRIAEKQLDATHTTPDSISIQRLLAEMVDAGCSHAFMEVSSHAIHQKRIAGLNFDGGVFTNITHDHLDYHITFDAYLKAKKLFFDNLPKSAFALTNKDDKNGSVFLQNTKAKPYYYSTWNRADFKAKILDSGWAGLHLQIDGQEIFTRITGEFNAYNLLAAYGVAILLGENEEDVLKALSDLKPPPGRFDIIHGKEKRVGIVDYAHTPDALEKVIELIREMRNPGQKIITVIGCGGNRDKGKRPTMARIAAANSDLAICTSDNPRDEDPMTILAEMEAGLTGDLVGKSITIPDRKEAIFTACQLATSNDIVLVAGKGHEYFQEIKGQRFPFDDKKILAAEL